MDMSNYTGLDHTSYVIVTLKYNYQLGDVISGQIFGQPDDGQSSNFRSISSTVASTTQHAHSPAPKQAYSAAGTPAGCPRHPSSQVPSKEDGQKDQTDHKV